MLTTQDYNTFNLKNFMPPFYEIGFNFLKIAEPLREGSLLLTTKSPGVPGTHLINPGAQLQSLIPSRTTILTT